MICTSKTVCRMSELLFDAHLQMEDVYSNVHNLLLILFFPASKCFILTFSVLSCLAFGTCRYLPICI